MTVTTLLAAGGPPGAPRVRVRLARRSDAPAVARLLGDRGLPTDELDVRRALTYDPLRREIVCAFALVDGVETLVGFGAVDLDPQAEPDTVVTDERRAPGLARRLESLLSDRARSHGGRAA